MKIEKAIMELKKIIAEKKTNHVPYWLDERDLIILEFFKKKEE